MQPQMQATETPQSGGIRAMSQENVEAFKRVVEAANRGRMHARGLESGVETESPWAFLIQFKNGGARYCVGDVAGERLGDRPRTRVSPAT